MIETDRMEVGCCYLFESMSSGRTCFFESNAEVELFRRLFEMYLSKYVEVYKQYLWSEGYQVFLRIRRKETLIKHYKEDREKRAKPIKDLFLKEPDRIVSEQMRKFKSLFAKQVNKLRGRKGVLVQKRFARYYFSSLIELQDYVRERERGEEERSQHKVKYMVSRRWRELVEWGIFRKNGVGSVVSKAFDKLVVRKLIKRTIKAHAP